MISKVIYSTLYNKNFGSVSLIFWLLSQKSLGHEVWNSVGNIKIILRKSFQWRPTCRTMLMKKLHSTALPGFMIKLSRHQNLIPQTSSTLIKNMGKSAQRENFN